MSAVDLMNSASPRARFGAAGRLGASLRPVASLLRPYRWCAFREIGPVAAAADRIQVLLAAQPAVTDQVTAAPVGEIVPRVVFDRVRFRYSDHPPDVLHGTSFTIEPGEMGGPGRRVRGG